MIRTQSARMTLPLAVLLVLVLAAFPLSSVFAAAASYTFHEQGTDTFVNSVPCGTELYTVTTNYNSVFHETLLDNGTSHDTATEEGTVTALPVDAGYPTYTGHYTFWDGFNSNTQNGATTYTNSVHLIGSDGSHVTMTEVLHLSVSAQGGVVTFDKVNCH